MWRISSDPGALVRPALPRAPFTKIRATDGKDTIVRTGKSSSGEPGRIWRPQPGSCLAWRVLELRSQLAAGRLVRRLLQAEVPAASAISGLLSLAYLSRPARHIDQILKQIPRGRRRRSSAQKHDTEQLLRSLQATLPNAASREVARLPEPYRSERMCRLAGERKYGTPTRVNFGVVTGWANRFLRSEESRPTDIGAIAEWVLAETVRDDAPSARVFRNIVVLEPNQHTAVIELDVVRLDTDGSVSISEVKSLARRGRASQPPKDVTRLIELLSTGCRLVTPGGLDSVEVTDALAPVLLNAPVIESVVVGTLGRVGFERELPLTHGELTAMLILIEDAMNRGEDRITQGEGTLVWQPLLDRLTPTRGGQEAFDAGIVDESLAGPK